MSPFSCSSSFIEVRLALVAGVEVPLCEVCIFEVIGKVPGFVVFWRVFCLLSSVLELVVM